MNQIIRNLWIGDLGEASLNHLEPGGGKFLIDVRWPTEYTYEPYKCTIRLTVPTTRLNEASKIITVDIEKMYIVSDIIHTLLPDQPTMVHCALGMERSPLTVVWYLMHHHNMNLGDAYFLVMTKHPQTIRHLEWLPQAIVDRGGLK